MPRRRQIELPREQFDILAQDEVRIVLYDKVVDKLYTYDVPERGWHFPPGSRIGAIQHLTGIDLTGSDYEEDAL